MTMVWASELVGSKAVVAVKTNGHAAAEPLEKSLHALMATPTPAHELPSPPHTPQSS